ncbi:MAG: sulfite exporter TauE/SafE family protein [Verrucomicrobia bacterium]|nr:MAG: sulfite exporter TauE/SafE family protein [Verrucomicrobiota bacterium]
MQEIHTTMGALIAGMITSVHCVGMCGPIACGLSTMSATDSERSIGMTVYHIARLSSYMVIGGLCGALGQQPLQSFFHSSGVLLPWLLAGLFLLFGLGLEKRLPRPLALLRIATKLRMRTRNMSPIRSGLALGLFTPLLPCGPLYGLFGISLFSGSAVRGAEFALAFGLGTVPLLWLAQIQLHRFRAKLKPWNMARLQRGLAITAALVMMWRLHDTLPIWNASAQIEKAAPELPSCCHEK